MPINLNKFVPRPGLVNQQGCLPDPSELASVEIPKVFDQRLIKRSLVYREGPDTNRTDCELRSNALVNPRRYLGSRDFNIALCSVDLIPLRGSAGYKKVILSYVISFWADYTDTEGVNRSELFEINRTDVIGRFYCPDPVAQVSAFSVSDDRPADFDKNYIKVDMVADALNGEFTQDDQGFPVLDITLGYYIIVKYELVVQLLVPVYDYQPIPEPLLSEVEDIEEDVCELFERADIPRFYPDENLEPLFADSDRSRDK